MQNLIDYFTSGIRSPRKRTIGAEVETMFIDKTSLQPITLEASQRMLRILLSTEGNRGDWQIVAKKGGLITELRSGSNNRIFYELGRSNFEVATKPVGWPLEGGHYEQKRQVLFSLSWVLEQLYDAAKCVGACPYFGPISATKEDLLVVPNERDASWIAIDGREHLAPLALTASVQFTFSVKPRKAIATLNRLGANIRTFLADFPQEEIWRTYIRDSHARYRPDRFGGPLQFRSLEHYCEELSKHWVVAEDRLITHKQAEMSGAYIPLFIRSVWWYFRLKRYGDALCIEVRPLARRADSELERQLDMVLDIVDG